METESASPLTIGPLRAARRPGTVRPSTSRRSGGTARAGDGPPHGQVGRPQDVEAVDLRGLGQARGPRPPRARADALRQAPRAAAR